MTTKENYDMLNPERVPKLSNKMKGERTVHRVSFTPTSINPGDVIRVKLPELSDDLVLVPKSFKLRFQLEVEVGKDTNYVVFNVSRNLVDTYRVKFGSHFITDIVRYDLYEGFHDLLTTEEDMLMGIMNLTNRKIRLNTSDKTADSKLQQFCDAYGKTYTIPLSHPIIDDYGCFNSRILNDKIEFQLNFAKKGDIVITTDLNKAYSYKLNNVMLEYKTMKNDDLIKNISSIYENGKKFHFEDVHLVEVKGPLNFSTQKTFRTKINMSIRSMKGILFLFTKAFTLGARNTEEFINPLISSVNTTINGVSHSLYAEGIESTDMWENILNKVGKVHKTFSEFDFQNTKFGLWVDLRSSQENTFNGEGKKFNDDGGGLVIDTTLKSTEASVMCHIFVVSDAMIEVRDRRVKKYIK